VGTELRGRVAELRAYGQPVELREYGVPQPEPGGLIVKMREAAICGSDLHVWRAETVKEPASPAGLGFGHEGFGTVAALGEGTTTDDAGTPLAVGDRVVHHVRVGSTGRDPNVRAYGGVYGQPPYFFSTFADYFYVAAGRAVYRVPDELPDEVLAPVNCAMGAAINALIAGGTTFGSRVVIFGAGGLGLTAAAAARDMGADRVIVLDRIPGRLELARAFGATETVNVDEFSTADERIRVVRELTDGHGADVALELAGLAALLPEGVQMLGRRGTFVEVGLYFTGTSVAFDPSLVLRGEKRIVGSAGYPADLLPVILDFLVRTKDVRPWCRLVSHRFPLEQINEAFELADWAKNEASVTRAVVVP
jgi:threonine dehydrogenase-like Zn-dependent dehydrogenase